MKRMLLLSFVWPVVACVSVPQTPEEYREYFKGDAHPAGGEKQLRTVERPFHAVLTGVSTNADKCFNVVVEHQSPGGFAKGPVIGWNTYRSKTRKTGAAAAEMVVQFDKKGAMTANGMPVGGFFIILADLEAVKPNRTQVTVYGPSMSIWAEAFDAVFSWAEGKTRKCPDLP